MGYNLKYFLFNILTDGWKGRRVSKSINGLIDWLTESHRELTSIC